MVSLKGMKLSSQDVETINQAIENYKNGTISAGEYNKVLLRIKNSKPKIAFLMNIISRISEMYFGIKEYLGGRAFVSRVELRKRVEICRSCENSVSTGGGRILLCGLCGCLISAKARLKASKCPDQSLDTGRNGRWIG